MSNPLEKGEVGAYQSLSDAKTLLGDQDALVLELEEILLRISKGEIAGRYTQTRLSAICRLLDMRLGKPYQQLPPNIEAAQPVNINISFNQVSGVVS